MMLFAQGFAPVLRRTAAVAAIAMVALPLAACSDEGRLVLHSSTGDYSFNVEVVDTPESRAQGLMYRTELAEDAGMLFDFKEERPVSFWMRNTFIPLDMIFVDAAGVVKTIHVNAVPHDVTGIPSEVPVQFVLEIPGGRSVEIGLKPGDTMEHERVGAPVD
ncbi:DUF192 domain-containing protein [Devosia ginsengisoli]|uniref:DUF192 domain-containing protein n=1 Tax=Devosia ginsengisoli TaxID=400770 RepID=UPI0026EC0DBC|nr:DUF192 domain-containing protein [Devosia ginsengisoli]MCR6672884.1 DUF192 domain-containing protein [Devosia ginsengisoli]